MKRLISENALKKCSYFGLVLFAIYLAGAIYLFYLSHILANDPNALTRNLFGLFVIQSRRGFLNFVMSLWWIVALLPATILLSIGIALDGHSNVGKIIFRTKNFVMRWGLLISVLLSLLAMFIIISYVFKGMPIGYDETVYLFQARTYSTGNLFLPVPPGPESISRSFMIMNWLWTAKYLWGHPAILSIGLLVGSPYFATVFMALASLFLLYSIANQIYSQQMATVATLLMGTSPWFWFVSGTLLTHVSMLFLQLLFIYGWLKLEHQQSFSLGAILGVCLGWAFTVRPLTAVCFAVPFVGLVVVSLCKQPRRWLRPAVGLFLGGSIVMILIIVYNTLVTGDPYNVPFLYYQNQERMGFGERNFGIYTPLMALSNLVKNVYLINMWLFGWPFSFFPLIAYLIVQAKAHFESIRKEATQYELALTWNSWDTLWIVLVILHCLGYFFYPGAVVNTTMPLYYYELLIPLVILTAKSLLYFNKLASQKIVKGEYLIPTFVSLSVLTSILFFVPFRAQDFIQRHNTFFKPVNLAVESISEKAIVFVGKTAYPAEILPYPSPMLDDNLLFVSLRNQTDYEKALRTFPERFPYIIFYDNKSAHYVIRKMTREAELSDYELSHCVATNFDKGKIDETSPPPWTLFFLNLLGFNKLTTQ